MGKKTPARKTRRLVEGYLERISSKVLQEFPKIVTGLVGDKHGVYALYKGDHLYYVGLATNLRNRIQNHLKDKHSGKWDKFSLYLVRKVDHIRELETLILRTAHPKGNSSKGRLSQAEDLLSDLDNKIKDVQAIQRRQYLGRGRQNVGKPALNRVRKSKITGKKFDTVEDLIKKGYSVGIRAERKGKKYGARLQKNGKVRFHGKIYDSLTQAAKAVTGYAISGTWFWKIKSSKNDWVRIRSLVR